MRYYIFVYITIMLLDINIFAAEEIKQTVVLHDNVDTQKVVSNSNDKPTMANNNYDILSVNDVINVPASFSDTIGIEGTVTRIIKNSSIFLIADEKCQTSCCSIKQIPVKYTNYNIPQLGDKVIVYGNIQQVNNRFIFNMSKLERIDNE